MKKSKKAIQKKFIRLFGFILASAVAVFNFTDEMRRVRALPEAVFIERGVPSPIAESFRESSRAVAAGSGMDETLGAHRITYRLFDLIELASVYVYESERTEYLPCGNAVGISIRTDGVAVVGFGDVITSGGKSVCPAREAGIKAGDIIKSVNGQKVLTSAKLREALDIDKENTSITLERAGRTVDVSLTPAVDGSGRALIGLWVRDSTIGIGTLSFVSKDGLMTAALGHAVVDADTGKLLPVHDGEMVKAEIIGVSKGSAGRPGELKGIFDSDNERIGSIEVNTELGVFGRFDEDGAFDIDADAFIPIAFPNEVKEGGAVILAQVGSGPVEEYSCRILRAVKQNKPAQKGLVIKITDKRLIEATGGIVQGMSGSPIIQDGKLIGVITHVFVNDSLKGYGIYAYWMKELMDG